MRIAFDQYEGTVQVGGNTISNLRFADEVVLIAEHGRTARIGKQRK